MTNNYFILELPFVYKFEDIQFSSKINTKCYPYETLKTLKEVLTEDEWTYFEKESQFQHLFHAQWDPQLKMAPAGVLINRSVKAEDEKELWFVLNGVPVRYSIIEHALICGLKCGKYPEEWESFKKSEFRKKTFGRKKVCLNDVVEKLRYMPTQRAADRKRLAIICLMAGILDHAPSSEQISHDLFDMVDDLRFCERFTWGRYTFDRIVDQVRKSLVAAF
ncbi:PREDICTED: uncharacterized protein LOC104804655 [Tarenaya hassleriana]|uniref:uncharacterized protein LOC104804655 n=1 Tax=Tarenaya hassleriana TaxID=28532 RepID=UPI00053C2DCA|nr:PREDICTED: uncharacterized protein LOC104804655 [Tarenaya hassleriana]